MRTSSLRIRCRNNSARNAGKRTQAIPDDRRTPYSASSPIARAVPQRTAYTHPRQSPKRTDTAEEYSMRLSCRSSSTVTYTITPLMFRGVMRLSFGTGVVGRVMRKCVETADEKTNPRTPGTRNRRETSLYPTDWRLLIWCPSNAIRNSGNAIPRQASLVLALPRLSPTSFLGRQLGEAVEAFRFRMILLLPIRK